MVSFGAQPRGGDSAVETLPRWIGLLLRFRFLLLAAVGLIYATATFADSGGDWAVFRQGATILFGQSNAASLSLYANNPVIQIGPVALAAAGPFAALPPELSRLLVSAAMTLALPGCLFFAERTARRLRTPSPWLPATVLVGGLIITPMWAQLAVVYAHLDDVLVLVFLVWAMDQLTLGKPWTVGIALGLATCSKPWAAPCLALAFALPWLQARKAVAAWALTCSVCWLPFVIFDHRTLGALAGFRVPVAPDSVFGLLGFTLARSPSWDRPAQLLIGFILALIAAKTGRWAAVPVLVIATRTLLDSQTFSYYYSGLLFATLLFELLGSKRRLPYATLFLAFVLYDGKWLSNDVRLTAVINAGVAAIAIASVFLAKGRVAGPESQSRTPAFDQTSRVTEPVAGNH